MRTTRPHTSSGSHPNEYPPMRLTHSKRHPIPTRPSTSSGVPDPPNQRPVSIVVSSPFAGVSPVPVRRFYYVIARAADLNE
jgi:hypothetical protein